MAGIYRFLDTAGDGTGIKDASGDYSITPTEFYFQPTVNSRLHRIIMHVQDASGGSAEEYGNLGAPLSNGYKLLLISDEDEEILDLCDGIPIKSNGGFGRYCYDVRPETSGAGDEFWGVRWTFAKSGDSLYVPAGWRLSITLSDDFSGLVDHTFMVQGKTVS